MLAGRFCATCMFFLMPGFLLANGGLSSKDGQNVVVGMMEGRDGALRLMAVDGLGTDEESIALLKQALTDSDQAVRELAAMFVAP